MRKSKIYKSDIYIDKEGYPRFKDNNKLVHRVVMEKILRRPLREDERVHHVDGDKTNFRRRNLQLVNKKDHFKIHVVDKKNVKRVKKVSLLQRIVKAIRILLGE